MAKQESREVVIRVENLDVDFWVDGQVYPAAKGVSFEVARGETLAIVGESGSGKSTTAMAILGLLPENSLTTGSVTLLERELIGLGKNELREVRGNDIAVIFQEPMTALNPVYTVGFQISEALRAHQRLSPDDARDKAIELIRQVELPNPEQTYRKYPHQLSGGQRQRALIAMAISCDPVLLIADEPTTALDVTVQAEILQLLRSLRSRLDSGIILITHDMGVVADMADRVIVMKDGVAVETGTTEDIFTKPRHAYTKSLLASVPRLAITDIASEPTATPTAVPALQFKNVAIEYPKRGRVPAFRAAEGVTFEVYPGETVGLVGESGSGKTTLGRAAVGLLPVREGQLSVVGVDITSATHRALRPVRRRTGIVFQDPGSSLNPRWPIGQSIGEPLLLAGEAKGKELDARVEDLLRQVELPIDYRNRYPHELSGGQRQRVGIARALALAPELLVADEPTSALDVSVQARFLDLLRKLQDSFGFACLFISHDLAVVDAVSDRIVVMHKGKIVEQGSKDAILRHPQDPYTQQLIAAVPVPDPVLQRARREGRTAI
ncbi:MAG: ABC transporter ATP-binding protein [Microbacteriaceae bacterium]